MINPRRRRPEIADLTGKFFGIIITSEIMEVYPQSENSSKFSTFSKTNRKNLKICDFWLYLSDIASTPTAVGWK